MNKLNFLLAFLLIFLLACNKKTDNNSWQNDAVIYEVNIRQYTPEGTIKAFIPSLKRLKNMGVKILWLMPIQPIGEKNRKGSLGSYYSIKNYTEVNPEFGTLDDLKTLVHEAHNLKMKIILDWVANHTSWDNVWTISHPEFYTKDSLGNFVPPVPDWSDVIDLNYDNPKLHKEMIASLKYWIINADVDGFRCDVAEMVPNDFWTEAITELNRVKPVFMLAEGEKPNLHKAGFNMTYNWNLLHTFNDIAKGEKSAIEISNYFSKEKNTYDKNNLRMLFITNHDENSWNGTAYERLGENVDFYTALTFTLKGMPLIYSGQEARLNKPLKFFEKDTIDWSNVSASKLYTNLFNIKSANKALWNGTTGGDIKFISNQNKNLLTFIRENEESRVVCYFNFSNDKEKLLNRELIDSNNYSLFSDGIYVENWRGDNLIIKPWSYKIFIKKN